MTQDQWMKEAEARFLSLLELLRERCAAIAQGMGSDYPESARDTAEAISAIELDVAVREFSAHLQQRPLPVSGEGVLVLLKRPEGYEDVHPELLLQDANINPAFEPEIVSRPLPVREGTDEPTAWRVRGYNQFKTSAPGPWRYFDGPAKPRVNIPSDCDFEPLYAASSPSVQNRGEGETPKNGVDVPLKGGA